MRNSISKTICGAMLACTLAITGCASPDFTIQRADDRFTENKNPVYTSENNRLTTRAITGGLHVDGKGVFINPYVEQDAQGKARQIRLIVVNRTSVDTFWGNRFRYGTLQQVVFRLEDGQLITLPLSAPETASPGVSTYNPMLRNAELEIQESARAVISAADYNRLASATTLSVRLTGTLQSFTYEEKDVLPAFLDNLRVFKEQHIR